MARISQLDLICRPALVVYGCNTEDLDEAIEQRRCGPGTLELGIWSTTVQGVVDIEPGTQKHGGLPKVHISSR